MGAGYFLDATNDAGLANSSVARTGFGTEWLDLENDGDLDLFVSNGAVKAKAALVGKSPYPYHQPNQLFVNQGDGRFEDVSAQAGEALALSEVSRGAAFGDIDNDGDIDIVVSNNNGPARLLLNEGEEKHHWLLIKLEGIESNRDGIGARIALLRSGQGPVWRHAHTDGSYLSAHDRRVDFGLGAQSSLEGVAVKWPSGRSEVWKEVEADTITVLREGSGEPWPK